MVGPVAALCAFGALVVLSFVNPWVFTADDSLFYLVVAPRLIEDGTWTFNGLTPTNGVQPLWQVATALVVAVADAVGLDSPAAQLRSVLVLNWALAVVALAAMWRLLERMGVERSHRLAGVVVLGACLCGPWGLFASEAHAVAASLVWLLLLLERWFREGPRVATAVGIGVASGLMMLSRLDTVWVALVAFGCLALVGPVRGLGARLQAMLPAVAAAVALVVPYLAWNLVRFEHLTPISGAIKVDLSSPRWSLDGIGSVGAAMILALWVAGALGVLRAPRERSRLIVWLVPAVGATASSAFYVVFSQGTFTQWRWYLIPHAVALALAIPLAADRLAIERPRSAPALARTIQVACVALAAISLAVCVRRATGTSNDLWAAGRSFSSEVADVVPEGAPVATVDLPGVLAFVSDHPVLALDGLTGDFELQARLRDDGAACVLEDLGIDHVVTVYDRRVVERTDRSVTLVLASWLHREPPTELRASGPLLVSENQQFALWQVETACDRSG